MKKTQMNYLRELTCFDFLLRLEKNVTVGEIRRKGTLELPVSYLLFLVSPKSFQKYF